MQQSKSFLLRALVHAALVVWCIYSVLPFVMSIITSFQITRDATARQPRFMPQAFVDNNILIGVVITLVLLGLFYMQRGQPGESRGFGPIIGMLITIGGVVGLLLFATTQVAQNQVFTPTWANYQQLWISGDAEIYTPVAMLLLALAVGIVVAGLGAQRLSYGKSYVYLGIVAVIVATIVFLPNFVRVAEFYDFFLNSVIVTVGTVVISISIGCLAGYGLARYSGVAGVVLLFGALAFRALPRLAFILPYYYFAQLTGLYDTYFLLIITFVAINQPFTIWMLRSFFMEIPRELEEAAMIDGCSRLSAFWRVIIPITWPGIITTGLFTLLLAYNEFLLARLLTSTLWTLPVGISRFTSGEDVRLLPLSNASAVSITLPIIFIIIFFQRHLIKGLTGGAVKG
jgi:multiple sugar transport system permease protein